jgi:thiol:disulfide interchange protein DsbA
MRALLNTLGATVWGLIAIILAAAVAITSYRLTVHHSSDFYSRAQLSIRGAPQEASRLHAAPQTQRLPTTPDGARDTRALPLARTAGGSSYERSDPTAEQPEQTGASTVDAPLIGHFVRPPAILPTRSPAISRVMGESETVATPTSGWVEGRHYERIPQAHPTALPPGKVLVTEFFSYASSACYWFEPAMRRLVESLPPNAVVDYVAPSWSKDWPTFQLAYVTAHTLGASDASRAVLFDAVWNDKGELAFFDGATGLARAAAPTIEGVARFYEIYGVAPAAKFLQTSKSFAVERERRLGDRLVADYGIDRVPTIVVNGKYRLHVQSAGSPDRLIELVNYLVRKEAVAVGPS